MIAGTALEGRGERRVICIDASKKPDEQPIEAIRLAARTEGMQVDRHDQGRGDPSRLPRALRPFGGQPALSAYAHTPGLGGWQPNPSQPEYADVRGVYSDAALDSTL